ncbi:uncharacterized protein LOC132583683 isoform X2 [Heteronotia binoei]|uniref:uncharacterized protein LOC132583683 isoform X2 n=1 Tax=Heteronotia binoei TaxID=13085 RepID=UPI00292D4A9E|nr:uncharacterized protein LOC132583683 isoform X2 [Heteronotia binoei]
MKEVVVLLFCVGLLVPLESSSLLALDYPISLYHRDSLLSTVLWFRPPYCLYELWYDKTLDHSLATWQTATIEMQVKLEGDDSVYKATQRFPIPICSPTMVQSLDLGDHACEMGPSLACLNDTCMRAVLPGRMYRIRYLLCNKDHSVLAVAGWSKDFRTRDMPHDFRTMDVDFGKHSTGMVLITALATITMFLLLGAAGLALIVRPPSFSLISQNPTMSFLMESSPGRSESSCLARSPSPRPI